ncbi:ankyrin repeat domain-containing protein [Trichocoleus sp. DQ-U1]|uniref:ankyrin repeat domain-containing protein n=1 Tax=Trichocoleus sp. DQ-U1 TaxID=2933926 RepID=UPI003297EEDF
MNAENKTERLFEAIQSSDVEQVNQLLDSGVDANRKNYSRGQHPLVLASSIGNLDIVEALLEAGANVNAKSGIAKSPKFNPTISVSSVPGNASLGEMISEALEDAPDQAKGFFAGFTQFVDAFSDENSISSAGTNEQQNSSQDEGVEFDEEENFDEEEEKTALIVAIASGHVEIVKTLLKAGAEVNPNTWHDSVPLVVAAKHGQLEIVHALISAGAEVNKPGWDCGGYTPLGMAVEHGQVEIVRVLLEAGANPLGGDSETTSLAIAAVHGYIEIMQLLLKTGVDINYPKGSYTALIGAANNGQFKMVQMLVEAGADVNAWYEGSNTPLRYAAYNGHREIHDYLYPLGAEDIRKYGEREIEKGVKKKERLQKKDVEDFIDAAMFGKVEAVKAAIEKEIDINAIGSNGETALMYAAHYVLFL